MTTAFLIALLFCIALFVYALRVTGDRNRLQREAEFWRDAEADRLRSSTVVVFGTDFANDSPRKRELRAVAALRKARRK